MQKRKVFISSVQSEFAEERKMLFDYLTFDNVLGKFFEPFIFEKSNAKGVSPSDVFLKEVENCEIYLGIFGQWYGYENEDGVSPTEMEFDAATKGKKTRLVYVKSNKERHPKEETFIRKVEKEVVRRSFSEPEELRTAVYASLVDYLFESENIRTTPFDATFHPEASIADLSEEEIRNFAEDARKKRNFHFDKDSNIVDVLSHLNLIKGDRVANAALLLFAEKPERFFITAEIRCVHYQGVTPEASSSYQVYRGPIFGIIEQAVDFVLKKIACPEIKHYVDKYRDLRLYPSYKYELPVQAVTEAIVNAVAHRDYTSNASVQVMLFDDRLEVSNPGKLPASLTVNSLYGIHNSVPANTLLVESFFLCGRMERMGTGIEEMIKNCENMGLKRPEFIQDTEFIRTILYKKPSRPGV